MKIKKLLFFISFVFILAFFAGNISQVSAANVTGTVIVTVPVALPTPTVNLTPSSSSINLGQSVTMTWGSTNSNYCIITSPTADFTPESMATSGSFTTSPTQTTTYTATCYAPNSQCYGGGSNNYTCYGYSGGDEDCIMSGCNWSVPTQATVSATISKTVTVTVPPAPSGTLTASNCTIALGASSCTSNLSWTTTNPITGVTSAVTTPTNITVKTANTSTTTYTVAYPNRIFYLYHNGVELANATSTASCIANTTWDGSKCAVNVTVPLTPTNLTATPSSCGTGTINISWTASTGATSYTLKDGANTIYSGAGTSYSHTGLTAGSSHSYTIISSNSAGSSSSSSVVSGNAPSVCASLTPDLIASITAPTSIEIGVPTTFSSTITNQGTAATGVNFYNLFQGTASPLASILNSTNVNDYTSVTKMTALASGASATASKSIMINSSSYAGNKFYLRACADKSSILDNTGLVDEGINEGNNCSSWTLVSINGQPDLTASSVSPTTATMGVNTTFNSTITNQGTAATGANFFNLMQWSLNSNGVPVNDIPRVLMNTIPAGGSFVQSIDYKFTNPGTYYGRVCADKDSAAGTGLIAESNEGNNCGLWTTITVSSPPVDTCGLGSSSTPQLIEPVGVPACAVGVLNSNSPVNTTTNWNWSCGTVTNCSAPKYGCTTNTDTNYNATGPNNDWNCALTCLNGNTNYPACTSVGPTCTVSTDTNYNIAPCSGICTNGNTNYPTCTPTGITNGGWNSWVPARSIVCGATGKIKRTCTNPSPSPTGVWCTTMSGTFALEEIYSYSNNVCPNVTLTINPIGPRPYNSKVKVNWTSTNATSCECKWSDTKGNGVCGSSVNNEPHTYASPVLKRDTTYEVTCFSSDGVTDTAMGIVSIDDMTTSIIER